MSTHTPGSPGKTTRPVPVAVVQLFKERFNDSYSDTLAIREQHGRDESIFDVPPPELVIFAENEEDVAFIAETASTNNIPLIPYGAGTSLEGQLLAVKGGISLDLSRMNKIIRINAEDMTATVEAGVTREQLNQEIKDIGLFFPIDPGANATLGGMASTRASGTNAVRYGSMREAVLQLKVVTPGGEIIRTGTRARKSSAGYDLTRLFVGSEGTLGIITELTVRLFPLPEAVSAAICSFPDVESAIRTTIEAIQLGLPLARCEFMDLNAVLAVNQVENLGLRETPLLLMEFHGSPAGVEEQVISMQAIAEEHSGSDFEWANTTEARNRLWRARHKMLFSGMVLKPGSRVITTDTCVPISRLADCILETVRQADESGLVYFIVGHVGDGNFHVIYLIDPALPAERELAERLNHDLVLRAIRMDGTCTGEHGIGLHKIDFLPIEAGLGAVALMRSIKLAIDPNNIMNPGKIFPVQ
ncbi:2-hydroxy-acid oxidase [Pseudomonas ogarae]|uniref:FAD-binding oxidoreductase n=1 Tax=Pseudomonas ogarae (strain DSM 112162 / CECT 30235 / F113) TaxID=1114970 RepID=UPI0009A40925|nr:FAD-linked oxidase C-terminal domain-containing protein [Pseudomonas ogarae]OPG72150.1 2-hydroxy-acid oxidase [Pseudomonas ogarae]